jgi:hypothetical protein
MKSVLFTLNQLQCTLDLLARKTQSPPQAEPDARESSGVGGSHRIADRMQDKNPRS